MYHVFAYKDKNGKSPVKDYLTELTSKGDKDSRIKASKIFAHIAYLKQSGPRAKEPYAKNLGDGIWELRPLRDRILYAAWSSKSFIMLHVFMKDTQKTPKREIEQAKRNLADIKERGIKDEFAE